MSVPVPPLDVSALLTSAAQRDPSLAPICSAWREASELIRVNIGNVASLGPAGALASTHEPYTVWLAQLRAHRERFS